VLSQLKRLFNAAFGFLLTTEGYLLNSVAFQGSGLSS